MTPASKPEQDSPMERMPRANAAEREGWDRGGKGRMQDLREKPKYQGMGGLGKIVQGVGGGPKVDRGQVLLTLLF